MDGLEEYKNNYIIETSEKPKNLALINGKVVGYSVCHKYNNDGSAEWYNEYFTFLGEGTISHYWVENLHQYVLANGKEEHYFWV